MLDFFISIILLLSVSASCTASDLNTSENNGWKGKVWDLSTDWSDTQNPNGVWIYGRTERNGSGEWGSVLPIISGQWSPFELNLGIHQPGWTDGKNGTPGWAKCIQDPPIESGLDIRAGDVINAGWSMVQWVSPFDGEIRLSGNLWRVHKPADPNHKIDVWVFEREGWTPSTNSRRHQVALLDSSFTRDNSKVFDLTFLVDKGQHVCLFFGTEPPASPTDLAGCNLHVEALNEFEKPIISQTPGEWIKPFPSGSATCVSITKNQDLEICYSSGQTRYIESLIGDRWMGRYWNADGRTTYYDRWDSDAFEIGILEDPSQTESTLLTSGWRWASAHEEPRTEKGARHYVVELTNALKPIILKIHTLLDGTPILTRWLEITNQSQKSIALKSLTPWCGRLWDGDSPFSLLHSIRSDGGWEGWIGWTPLEPGANFFRNDKGLVYDDPFFVLRNISREEYFIGELAWPANYEMAFQRDQGLSFKLAPAAKNALRVLTTGESIHTPAVHLGCVAGNFDAAVQAMHDHIRRTVLPKRPDDQCYRVQYLMPEDQGMTVYRSSDYNEDNVRKAMDVAAAVGVELFIVDGPTWAEGYGNWVPKKAWFPNGFGPLLKQAQKDHLRFGIYSEPEGGRGDWSDTTVWKEHHDWFKIGTVLDLSQPDATNYMRNEWTHMIEYLKINFYRHDINTVGSGEGSTTLRDGFTECDYWRHYDAFYGLTEEIQRKYPDLILQQASGGGTRLDLATAACWDEHYTSDRAVMPYLYRMASGLSVYLPPEILVTPNGMTNQRGAPNLDTLLRGIYTLGNTPMIFNGILPRTVAEFTPSMKTKFQHYDKIFKNFIRPLLSTCKVYHHAPVNSMGGVEDGPWFAMEFTSPDKAKGWATVIRLKSGEPENYILIPHGLDQGKTYSVTFDSTGAKAVVNGYHLQQEGIVIENRGDLSSEILLFEAR